MRACGIDTEGTPTAPRGRRLHQPRGAASSATRRRSPARTRSPATGTTARPTCCGSASAPASSTAPTSSSCAASATRSAASSARPPTPDEVLELCEALNPARVPGRLTLITRMGADRVEDRLRPLLRPRPRRRPPGGVGVRPDARQHLHRRASGRKTRHFDDILRRDRRLRAGPPGRGHVARREARSGSATWRERNARLHPVSGLRRRLAHRSTDTCHGAALRRDDLAHGALELRRRESALELRTHNALPIDHDVNGSVGSFHSSTHRLTPLAGSLPL